MFVKFKNLKKIICNKNKKNEKIRKHDNVQKIKPAEEFFK